MVSKFRIDFTIVITLLLLGIISTLLIYSATENTKFAGLHIDHAIFFGVLSVLMMGLSYVQLKNVIQPLAYVFYGMGIFLLLLVPFIGISKFGATRWLEIKIGSTQLFEFQPSELMKILLVFVLAKFLARREGQPLRFTQDLIPAFLFMLVPLALILLQPDLGTSIVFIAIFIAMIWMANITPKHVLLILLSIITVIGLLVAMYFITPGLFSLIIQDHQMNRIQSFLDPSSDPSGDRYHVNQALMAISVGQLTGTGFMQGQLVNNVPVTYSDSIFTVVGEEFGFLGSSVLILLFFLLVYRLITIALECQDLFKRYVIVGIAAIMTFQIFVNIGMHLGLLPLTGLPLPFLSYGRSSLLLNIMSIGIVLSFYNQELNEER